MYLRKRVIRTTAWFTRESLDQWSEKRLVTSSLSIECSMMYHYSWEYSRHLLYAKGIAQASSWQCPKSFCDYNWYRVEIDTLCRSFPYSRIYYQPYDSSTAMHEHQATESVATRPYRQPVLHQLSPATITMSWILIYPLRLLHFHNLIRPRRVPHYLYYSWHLRRIRISALASLRETDAPAAQQHLSAPRQAGPSHAYI